MLPVPKEVPLEEQIFIANYMPLIHFSKGPKGIEMQVDKKGKDILKGAVANTMSLVTIQGFSSQFTNKLLDINHSLTKLDTDTLYIGDIGKLDTSVNHSYYLLYPFTNDSVIAKAMQLICSLISNCIVVTDSHPKANQILDIAVVKEIPMAEAISIDMKPSLVIVRQETKSRIQPAILKQYYGQPAETEPSSEKGLISNTMGLAGVIKMAIFQAGLNYKTRKDLGLQVGMGLGPVLAGYLQSIADKINSKVPLNAKVAFKELKVSKSVGIYLNTVSRHQDRCSQLLKGQHDNIMNKIYEQQRVTEEQYRQTGAGAAEYEQHLKNFFIASAIEVREKKELADKYKNLEALKKAYEPVKAKLVQSIPTHTQDANKLLEQIKDQYKKNARGDSAPPLYNDFKLVWNVFLERQASSVG